MKADWVKTEDWMPTALKAYLVVVTGWPCVGVECKPYVREGLYNGFGFVDDHNRKMSVTHWTNHPDLPEGIAKSPQTYSSVVLSGHSVDISTLLFGQ